MFRLQKSIWQCSTWGVAITGSNLFIKETSSSFSWWGILCLSYLSSQVCLREVFLVLSSFDVYQWPPWSCQIFIHYPCLLMMQSASKVCHLFLIDSLYNWGCMWNPVFNTSKCKVMYFAPSSKSITPNIHYNIDNKKNWLCYWISGSHNYS